MARYSYQGHVLLANFGRLFTISISIEGVSGLAQGVARSGAIRRTVFGAEACSPQEGVPPSVPALDEDGSNSVRKSCLGTGERG